MFIPQNCKSQSKQNCEFSVVLQSEALALEFNSMDYFLKNRQFELQQRVVPANYLVSHNPNSGAL